MTESTFNTHTTPVLMQRALAWGAVLGMLSLLAAPSGALAWGETPVPNGAFQMGVDVTARHWGGTIADSKTVSLGRYLGQEAGPEALNISGNLARDTQEFLLQPTWGLSDQWNFILLLPLVSATQTGSLSTTSTNASALGAVKSLKADTVSGLGDIRLINNHLLKYDDWMAFSLGYGLIIPGNDQAANLPYHSLTTSSPTWGYSYHARLQWYPYVGRAMFDFFIDVNAYFAKQLPMFSGNKTLVNPGKNTRIEMAWKQDWGGFLGELRLIRTMNDGDFWKGANQKTFGANSTQLAFSLGTGSLHLLEEGQKPPAWQADIQMVNTLMGSWLPNEDIVRARLTWYW